MTETPASPVCRSASIQLCRAWAGQQSLSDTLARRGCLSVRDNRLGARKDLWRNRDSLICQRLVTLRASHVETC